MNQKTIFKQIFLITVVILTVLPALVMFSSILTEIFNHIGWYLWIQKTIVPFEARLVAVIVRLVGIKALIVSNQEYSLVLESAGKGYIPVSLEWNCLGWQSMILLLITFITGLRGKYTVQSKLAVILLGVLGTFLINLFRMAFIVSLSFYINDIAALIIHDYFAALVALVWMLFFWWFSYSFVLEEK